MMESRAHPPLIVNDGTLTQARDMVRALETVESLSYRYLVDGDVIAHGRATLVRIMADGESSSVLVNGCLFLNVSSFHYLNFRTDEVGQAQFELFTDGAMLEIRPLDEPELRGGQRQVIRLMEDSVFDANSVVSIEDDEDDD